MNLCIDQGNSGAKLAVFNNDLLLYENRYPELTLEILRELFQIYPVQSGILSAVIDLPSEIIQFLTENCQQFIVLNHMTPVPVDNRYETPETLGKDRLAAVIGAQSLMPATDLLVIDAGTAITYDFVDADGAYFGGNIAPGLELRLKALHVFTGKLPLTDVMVQPPLLGVNTISAIQAGVFYGIVFEMNGYIDTLKVKYPKLSIFLTGGGGIFFENNIKSPIFAVKNLVLIGLNRILQFNAQK